MPANDLNALSLIGDTPMVRLDRISLPGTQLFAKVEFAGPGGSIPDRASKAAVLGARRRGTLEPGQPVVEMTSGNLTCGLP